METKLVEQTTLVDLSKIDIDGRKAAWLGAAPIMAPGLSVSFRSRTPSIGSLKHVTLGEGSLWAIRSSPVAVEYHAQPTSAADNDFISLLVQMEGSTLISHNQKQAALLEGDIYIIDEHLDFGIVSRDVCGLVVLKLPRRNILARLPHLEPRIASVMTGSQPGASILREMILSLARSAEEMAEDERPPLLTAVSNILSAALSRSDPRKGKVEGRVASALTYIDFNFLLPELTAEDIACAQNISRRRLDQILVEATGLSITGHVWKRRLEHASADLLDPQHSSRTITEVAYNNGFQDSAHFSRAFRNRFGSSPVQWRLCSKTGGSIR